MDLLMAKYLRSIMISANIKILFFSSRLAGFPSVNPMQLDLRFLQNLCSVTLRLVVCWIHARKAIPNHAFHNGHRIIGPSVKK